MQNGAQSLKTQMVEIVLDDGRRLQIESTVQLWGLSSFLSIVPDDKEWSPSKLLRSPFFEPILLETAAEESSLEHGTLQDRKFLATQVQAMGLHCSLSDVPISMLLAISNRLTRAQLN